MYCRYCVDLHALNTLIHDTKWEALTCSQKRARMISAYF
jgi:hypothetical protein